MDNNRPQHPIPILNAIMAMIPARSMLRSLPPICMAIARSNRAFSLRNCTIRIVCIKLSNAMKVYTCAIEWELVADSDFDIVSPVGFDGGAGILPVDGNHVFRDAIGGEGFVVDVKTVLELSEWTFKGA